MGSPSLTENGGGGGGGGGGEDDSPLGFGPWNVVGLGVRDDRPSRRDIVRRRPVEQQLAFLTEKLTTRVPGTPKFATTERRLGGIRDVWEAAITLGIDPARQTRRVIREIGRLLGLDINLKKIERGVAPDLSVLATAHRAASAGSDPTIRSTPDTRPQPSPDPQPTATGAPPGLPSSWWDWELWQRALYGVGSLFGLFGADRNGAATTQPRPAGLRVPPSGALPRPPQPLPAPPPGSVGGTPVIHDNGFFGDIGSTDWGGLLEAGLDVFQDYYYGSIADPGPGGAPLPGTRSPSGQYNVAGLGPGGAAALGSGAAALLAAWMGSNGAPAAAEGLFKATEARIIPRARIDAVGPDGRCYTWFRAVPFGWKVRGTRVGTRRHHHHYRKR